MQSIESIEAMRRQVRNWHVAGLTVGFVPTMGNLHGGHLSLVDEAMARSDRVVVSIFVNPAQFGPGEDYETYPRTRESDLALLRDRGVDCVFLPSVKAMYPEGGLLRTRVEVPAFNGMLCDLSRPGFFNGVALVVTKLFNIVCPDLAVFGLKDYQQFLVVQHLVRDLDLPIEIIGAAVAREPDGLAMSSRNAYLGEAERARAPVLYQTLRALADRLRAGSTDIASLRGEGMDALSAAAMKPDYVEIRRASDLGEPGPGDRDLVVAGAAYLGRARLIDNVRVNRPPIG